MNTELQARIDLAAAYRLIALNGMDDLAFTHISMRVPGEPGHFLINPFGTLFHEVTASSLVKIDHEGNKIDNSSHRVNRAGFVIHSALHSAREDVQCVLHTHTVAGVGVSCLEEGLLPLDQWALGFSGRTGYHDYEGIALDLEERARLIANFAQNKALILRNHGLLTVGRSVAEAFRRMFALERACRVQMQVLATGRPIRWPSPNSIEKVPRQLDAIASSEEAYIEWPGLLRMLDALDPSYRH